MTNATPKLWFVTGSQHLYGPETLKQVDVNSRELVSALDASEHIPLEIEFKGVLTTPDDIRAFCIEANSSTECAGVVLWMHTFSPSKMWIGGLSQLKKPFLHLHTQFNRDLPWDSIDMDFMNLNQAAHGDREAGFIHTRMRLERKVVVGHYSDVEVQQRLGVWASAAHAWHDLQGAKFCRFGDNMRFVAVTEGDKVAAEMRFGFSVNTYGVGDLVQVVDAISDAEIDRLVAEYEELYDVAPELKKGGERHDSLRYSARLELGIEKFLVDGGFKGFTTTFEDLHGLKQLPGMAVQRLMAKGYGFAGEGDWKTAVLLSALKTMSGNKATSFMEDYTYHLEPGKHQVLGSHMLEVCPTIAESKPRVEIHPLGIGGKEDPVRLVFDSQKGEAINVSLVDLGSRFRLIVNEVTAVEHPELPNLPVARAVWECKPDFKTACAAWIYAGGAHHTVYSYTLTSEHIEDFAAIAGVELVVIDADTKLRDLKQDLKFSDLYYALGQGLRV
ncbi:L-arabinose isomerase [Deinococcus cellulosilyticus]|uniref:L-arabinose isomerase n=1 Tax=Deinococcus cellulosilyticus (strain DSM 18568 / NBRC 106333 / KACC 11606 / 5516J-15) TaxID=1223518 RepID=A0A511N2U5_DEIC1|nr:L-arabinose isomerase [Deinococcus cellulosilyticus]GEM46778.1 L-arabinose isomerase [Deinococcus cellulosilyticus NBRC 106333 = KACC 11606]